MIKSVLPFIIALAATTAITMYGWYQWNPIENTEIGPFLFQQLPGLIEPAVKAETQKAQYVDIAAIKARPDELVRPENVYAQYEILPSLTKELDALEKCSGAFDVAKDALESLRIKLRAEYSLKCEKSKGIPDFLWKEPPFIHPYGGSWAVYLHKNYSMALTDAHKPFIHVADAISEQKFSPEALQALLSEDPIFFQKDLAYIFMTNAGSFGQFLILPKNKYEDFSRDWLFRFVPQLNEQCAWVQSTGCWVRNISWIKVHRLEVGHFSVFMVILGLSFLLAVSIFERKKAEELLHLSAMAISHELRHPVSVMSLVLDRWREQFDKLADVFQDDFMNLTKEVGRLRLLMRSSEVFLKSSTGEAIKWQPQMISSLNAWGKRITDSYSVSFQLHGEDRAFSTDAYWLGVAIENLIKNALRHGKPPVELHMYIDHKNLEVAVVDQGEGFKKKSLKEDENLGFGHHMIQKISRAMGGDGLKHSSNPSRFSFKVKEISNEKDSSC